MSLQIEYRRLAAACLDLAKRAVVQTDKTRLLLIAEAWLDLAERVTRNNGYAERQNDGSAEHALVTSGYNSSESAAGPTDSAPSGTADGPACN